MLQEPDREVWERAKCGWANGFFSWADIVPEQEIDSALEGFEAGGRAMLRLLREGINEKNAQSTQAKAQIHDPDEAPGKAELP